VIDRLVREGTINVSDIAGHWEAAAVQTVSQPLPEAYRALVIAGSDKRGTIFGVNDLSEQASPTPFGALTRTGPLPDPGLDFHPDTARGLFQESLSEECQFPQAAGPNERPPMKPLPLLAGGLTILYFGHPLPLGSALADSIAFVAARLSTSEGPGITDVLFGDDRSTGKWPCTWKR
jgi:hypothetical protein